MSAQIGGTSRSVPRPRHDSALETSATLAACPKCGWLNLPAEACVHCGTTPDPPGSAPRRAVTGDALVDSAPILDGRYRVLAKLGEGGMGAVYRVEHIRMGKILALKVLRSDLAKQRSSVQRFHQEGRMVSRLSHPNTITVFDSGETENGLLYLAMEYVPGRDLAEILASEGPFEERRALRIIIQVLRSLAEAHEAGIIHRDIKPGNIMLTRTRDDPNMVKVLDFGIAKLTEAAQAAAHEITGGADLVGTPSCMSPEQARGKELDARSDLYSVTAMLFELLTGRGPFVGGPLQVVTLHLTQPPPTLREIRSDVAFSEAVEAIIAKGLQKDPAQRFQSADEMRVALERVLGDPLAAITAESELNLARREDWDALERSFRREYYGTRALMIGGALALLVGGAWWTVERSQALRAEPEPVLSLEVEPNDVAPAANHIGLGIPVEGSIGGQGKPDQDMFELTVKEAGTLQASVTGVSGVNLMLELFQETDDGSTASPIAASDDAAIGLGERISDLPVRPGRYLARLRDRRRLDEPDGSARENLEARYTLLIRVSPPRPLEELEPNNDLSHPMSVALERPVLGSGGLASWETVTRPGAAPPPTWSVDNYLLEGLDARETVCGLLGGVPGATLRLTAYRKEGDQLRAVRSIQVRDRRTGAVCARGDSALYFEVRVDVGDSGEGVYPLAFLSTRPGGFTGLLSLARVLPTLDRALEARRLLKKAIDTLPRADDVPLLREALLRTPAVETAAEEEEVPTSSVGEALSLIHI